MPCLVVHDFNPNTREIKAGRLLNSRPVWSMEGVPGLHRETCLVIKKKKKNKKEEPLVGGVQSLSFCMGSKDQTHIRLGGKYIYPLMDLASFFPGLPVRISDLCRQG